MIAERTLTPAERRHLLSHIYHTLRHVEPAMFGHHNVHRPGGLDGINEHLDQLVAIVRQTRTPLPEAHLAMILDRICETCPYEFPSRYCPLRHIDGCVLYRNSEAIIPAIACALAEFADVVPLCEAKVCAAHGS
jgi:hypothetical protein